MAKTEYHVSFQSFSVTLGPELTGLDKPLVLGSGYYVQRVTGEPGNYKVELVDGPYTPATAEARAEEWREGKHDGS